MSESSESHRRQAAEDAGARSVRCAVLTVSDSRTRANDRSGDLIEELLTASGHLAEQRDLVPDEPAVISTTIEGWLADPAIHAILTTGGTGIGRRDSTIEVVRGLLTAELDGFGELFRVISYEQIAAAAMLSRAVAGLVARDDARGGDTFLFAMPGSVNAVRTAMEKLVLPELRHLVWERRR